MHIIHHQVQNFFWEHLNLEKSFAGYQSAIGRMCDQPKERIRKPANSCKTKNHREKKSQWDNQTITNIIIFKQFLRWCQCGWSTNFLSVSFFSGLSPNNWRGDIIWFLELILFTNMRCVVKRIFFSGSWLWCLQSPTEKCTTLLTHSGSKEILRQNYIFSNVDLTSLFSKVVE